jgi:hypothetical protein
MLFDERDTIVEALIAAGVLYEAQDVNPALTGLLAVEDLLV